MIDMHAWFPDCFRFSNESRARPWLKKKSTIHNIALMKYIILLISWPIDLIFSTNSVKWHALFSEAAVWVRSGDYDIVSTWENKLFLLVHSLKKTLLLGQKEERMLFVENQLVPHSVFWTSDSKIIHFKHPPISSQLPPIVHRQTYLLSSWPRRNVSFTEDWNVNTH